MKRLAGFVLLAALLLGACGSEEEKSVEVRVAAASDLRAAFDEMEPDMERACSCNVVLVYGSSGLMREQIAAGADFGLYFSADENFVRSLIDEGYVVRDTARGYATGRLALAWRDGLNPLSDVSDLVRSDIQVVTIAQHSHAPYGRAAREAMQHHGVWIEVEPRIVYGENVRQTTDYVATGNADAGIVALSLTVGSDIPYVEVPDDEHDPLTQASGVVIGIAEAEATRVLDYVTGNEGQALMSRYGFGAPATFVP
ncbi:MAG: molybdate ABC transporter substrate-binding protein [Chloroflexi bacterium]|nr:molybdate ABC transporter substrate-binding protein [Chloroflexota bacterium]